MHEYMTTPEDRRALRYCFGAIAVVVLIVVAPALAHSQEYGRQDDGRERVTSNSRHSAHKRTKKPAKYTKVHDVKASGIVTVPTAAGINIAIAAGAAGTFQGFIGDLVAQGYRPKQIHCFATKGHVRNSNHYRGMACDFDQSGWGKTAAPMYRVASLARKWGLRDGCTFRDCGHVDIPVQYARHQPAKRIRSAMARP